LDRLDFGCGDGGYDEITEDRLHRGSWLENFGGDGAIGIDYNLEKVRSASKYITNGTNFIVADGQCLPFQDNTFDLVHCYGTLHHMDDYSKGIWEIIRVLKSGGKFYLVETVDNDLVYKIARRIWGQWRDDKISSFFTSDDIEDKVRVFGGIITETRYYHRFILSDFLYNYKKEPMFSLRLNHIYSELLRHIGLDQASACDVMIRGVKS
jgi:ubiquinone/menaquinone biosynthesis C-methylase UbiE